jgi:hypothetical protein
MKFPLWTLYAPILLSSTLQAETWSLDKVDDTMIVHGEATTAAGALAKSLVLDGSTVIELKNTADLNAEPGFTCSIWFNPYVVSGSQQVIAGKTRYSLNQRQWTLTLEPDGRLKAFLQQEGWNTIRSKEPLKAGH